MKKLFSTNNKRYTGLMHAWLLLLRICVGTFMLTHGLPKFQKILSGDYAFGDPLGIGSAASLFLIVFAEVFCSIFIFVGLGTRLASIVLAFTMVVAAFISHANDPFGKKELALLYLLIYLTLIVFGSGKYSVDKFISRGS